MIVPFQGRRPWIHESAFVDPGARVAGNVSILENSAIYFGSVVRGDDDFIVIGPQSAVLELCLIEAPSGHPVEIDKALVSHSAVVHGARVKEDAVVGIGAIVLEDAVVEEGAVVGAGSVVPPGKEIPSATLVLGIPAKVVRDLSEEEIRRFRRERELVLEKAQIYKKEISRITTNANLRLNE